MRQPHEILKSIQEFANGKIGRKITEVTYFHNSEVEDGENIDREIISSIQKDGVEIRHVSHSIIMDCGHVASPSEVAGICDICERRVCQECLAFCRKCGLGLCRYCYKVYAGEEGEETYCRTPCYGSVKSRRTAIKATKAAFQFFSRR